MKEIESFSKYLGISIDFFFEIAEKHRNLSIWKKDDEGNWYLPKFKQEFGFWKELLV